MSTSQATGKSNAEESSNSEEKSNVDPAVDSQHQKANLSANLYPVELQTYQQIASIVTSSFLKFLNKNVYYFSS
jgi:hypothetical protein